MNTRKPDRIMEHRCEIIRIVPHRRRGSWPLGREPFRDRAGPLPGPSTRWERTLADARAARIARVASSGFGSRPLAKEFAPAGVCADAARTSATSKNITRTGAWQIAARDAMASNGLIGCVFSLLFA